MDKMTPRIKRKVIPKIQGVSLSTEPREETPPVPTPPTPEEYLAEVARAVEHIRSALEAAGLDVQYSQVDNRIAAVSDAIAKLADTLGQYTEAAASGNQNVIALQDKTVARVTGYFGDLKQAIKETNNALVVTLNESFNEVTSKLAEVLLNQPAPIIVPAPQEVEDEVVSEEISRFNDGRIRSTKTTYQSGKVKSEEIVRDVNGVITGRKVTYGG